MSLDPAESTDPKLNMRVIKARHDLHNSIGHVLGFSEMLLEEAQEQGRRNLIAELASLLESSRHMIAQINEHLETPRIQAGFTDLPGLQRLLCSWAAQAVASVQVLARSVAGENDERLKGDLARIGGAAWRTHELATSALAHLTTPVAGETIFLRRAINPLLDFLPDRSSTTTFTHAPRQGAILVVDDLDENRELLSRRLARLGYSVQAMESGQRALESVGQHPPDLILLDILMPGLDGFEVLRRLKAEPLTQHIPVIMLSSADQSETAVHCIELGADDFLPKPFNTTLLVARIESSLAKKRLRDQETAFLKHLRAERDLSEHLLLNILPRPIAQRLKEGERIIADSFPEVTVLFSDFVGFTKMASGISPSQLVTRLNEIFSAFDDLCDRFGLEKIKMIGDAYMAVGGLPAPLENHAAAAADLALAMQQRLALMHAILPSRSSLRSARVNSGSRSGATRRCRCRLSALSGT